MGLKPQYHLWRQQHVGDMLDRLQQKGSFLCWFLEYDRWTKKSRLLFEVWVEGEKLFLDTLGAEKLVTFLCNELDIEWSPWDDLGESEQQQIRGY